MKKPTLESAQPRVESHERKQFQEDPVQELAKAADRYANLFYLLKMATAPRPAGGEQVNPERALRSPHNRIVRAGLLGKLRSREIPLELSVKKAKALDAIDRQYLHQGRVSVDLPGLGKQEAQFTRIKLPPEMLPSNSPDTTSLWEIDERASEKPPVFVIPAISGDLTGLEPLLRAAALRGREVVTVGYPDSYMGTVSQKFHDAAVAAPMDSLEPHKTYFIELVKELVGKESPDYQVELWGYSTGSLMIADMLRSPDFSKHVSNAVLFSPGGTTDQTGKDLLTKALPAEAKELIKQLRHFSDVGIAYDKKGGMAPKQKELRGGWTSGVFGALLHKKVLEKFPHWHEAKVAEGGKIIIVSNGKDELTRSYTMDQEWATSPNKQFSVLSYPSGSHLSPLLHADRVVSEVAKVRDGIPQERLTVYPDSLTN